MLLAGRIARLDDESLNPGALDSDVEPGQLRVGGQIRARATGLTEFRGVTEQKPRRFGRRGKGGAAGVWETPPPPSPAPRGRAATPKKKTPPAGAPRGRG